MKRIILALVLMASFGAQASSNPALYVFEGESALNSGDTKKIHGSSYQVEQEFDASNHRWAFGYLNEGTLHCYGAVESCKRDGLYLTAKFQHEVTSKVETSFDLGGYISETTIEEGEVYHYSNAVSMLYNMSISYQVTESVKVQARYGHTGFSSDNRNTDYLMFGIGWTPKN